MIVQCFSFIYLAIFTIAKADNGSNISEYFKNSNGMLGAKIYNAIKDSPDNLLIGTLSLDLILTAFCVGSDGNTLKELSTALSHPDGHNSTLASYKTAIAVLEKDQNLILATKFYLDKTLKLKPQYSSDISNNLNIGVELLDFTSQSEEARRTINKFIANKTNHKILELFSPVSIISTTGFAVADAGYFKSEWLNPFNSNDTKVNQFYGTDKDYKTSFISTGNKSVTANYTEDNNLQAQLLELPYKGNFALSIILPKDKNGLKEVENKLQLSATNNPNSSPFTDIFKNAKQSNVQVSLPKFTLEQANDLRDALQKIGVKDIFTEKSNLKKMLDGLQFVNKVTSTNLVSIDENGSEVTSATAPHDGLLFRSTPDIKVFNADHPFIFVIKHVPSGTPTFIGRFSHPV